MATDPLLAARVGASGVSIPTSLARRLSMTLIDIAHRTLFWDRRVAALQYLAELGDAGLSGLVGLLKSKNEELRSLSSSWLVSIGGRKVADLMLPLLSHRSMAVRSAAAEVLGACGDVESEGPLRSLLKDEAARPRKAAVAALVYLWLRVRKGPPLLELGDMLKDDPEEDVRREFLTQISISFHELDVDLDQLLKIALQVARGRSHLLYDLMPIIERCSFPIVFRELRPFIIKRGGNLRNDSRPDAYGEEALALSRPNDSLSYLFELLEDQETCIRHAAAQALFFAKPKKAIQQVVAALDNSDPLIRQYIAYILGELKDEKAIPYLLPHLDEEDARVRDDVVVALARLGFRGVANEILRFLEHSNVAIRDLALDAAAVLGLPEAVSFAEAHLRGNCRRFRERDVERVRCIHDCRGIADRF